MEKNTHDRWIKKYKPKCINDVIGNKENIELLKKYLESYSTLNPNIIIDGPNGVGKSLTIKLLLKELGFRKIIPDFKDIPKEKPNNKKKNKNIHDYYASLYYQKNVINMNDDKKVAIVIDDIDIINGKNEKNAVKIFHKFNLKDKLMPLIIVSSNKHNKIINTLKNKNKSNLICFTQIQSDQLIKFIKKICKNEKLKIKQNIYERIIRYCQGDVRCLINTLEQLKNIFNTEEITNEIFDSYSETLQGKNIEINIFNASKCILSNYSNIDRLNELYEIEKTIIPPTIHQNYINHIETQLPYITPLEKITLINNVSNCLSNGDNVEGFIYSNQAWDLQTLHGVLTCGFTSFLLNDFDSKLNQPEKIDFTKDMNKASIQKINTKNISKTQKGARAENFTIMDFIYINKIIKHLLEIEDYEEIAKLLKPYDLNIEQIDSLLKIDKLKKPKYSLTAKQKNKIEYYLNQS
jgi:replication factor C subunit 1